MKLKIRLWLINIYFLVIISILIFCNNQNNINIVMDRDFVVKTNIDKYITSDYSKHLYNVKDTGKTYEYKDVKMEIIKREFDNNDMIIFYSINSNKKTKLNFSFNQHILKVYPLEKYEIKKEYNNTIGYDTTSIPAYYIEFDNDESILISKNYSYNVLHKKYDNKHESILRNLIAERDICLDSENSSFNMIINGERLDGWFLLSKETLFNVEKDLKEYASVLNNNAIMSAWLTANGQYTKVPYSIDPYTKKGYSRNPGANQGKLELSLFKEKKGKIYYDLMWNKVMGLYNMKRHSTGAWYTEYTSTYISKPYGVYAPFVDTRHNENIAQFLEMVGNHFYIDEFKKASLYYPNYVVNEVEKGNIINLNNNLYLIPDYFQDDMITKTHASINHQLGTANLLLETYLKTNDDKYFNVGITILKGLEHLGDKWIRDNGDLWYRMNPDYSFDSTDYKTLTLNDLLIVQATLEEIGYARIPMFDKYIKSKYNYLLSIDYKIDSEIIKRLKEQRFITD